LEFLSAVRRIGVAPCVISAHEASAAAARRGGELPLDPITRALAGERIRNTRFINAARLGGLILAWLIDSLFRSVQQVYLGADTDIGDPGAVPSAWPEAPAASRALATPARRTIRPGGRHSGSRSVISLLTHYRVPVRLTRP
jgi:hypothetical protein